MWPLELSHMIQDVFQGPFVHVSSVVTTLLSKVIPGFRPIYEVRHDGTWLTDLQVRTFRTKADELKCWQLLVLLV
jgi:hypothetical protein